MGEPETGLGDVTPRKKAGFGTYVIIGVVALVVILGVTLFMPGGNNGDTPANDGTSPNTDTPVTIPQLKSSIDSLNTKVDGFSGRLANLETQVAGLAAPQVTQADFNSLQSAINSLSANVANWTEDLEALEDDISNLNTSGGLTYWLTEKNNDVTLHILSDRDQTFVAQVTLVPSTPFLLGNKTLKDAYTSFYASPYDYGTNPAPTITWSESVGNWTMTAVTFSNDYTTKSKAIKVTANEKFTGTFLNLPSHDSIFVRLLAISDNGDSNGGNGLT